MSWESKMKCEWDQHIIDDIDDSQDQDSELVVGTNEPMPHASWTVADTVYAIHACRSVVLLWDRCCGV